jgi:putative redox protein
MVEMSIVYKGEKHCEITHGPSKAKLDTDAPKDNHGRGESFSPTDLVGAALASCIVTTMAIVAERDGIEFKTASANVSKEMNNNPRKIARLPVDVTMPSGLTKEQRTKLEMIAHTCPVHRSLHPDVDAPIRFTYPD